MDTEGIVTPGMASALASVPEHSLPLMQAMSSASPFCEGGYLFFKSQSDLLAIGYPLQGAYDKDGFDRALAQALGHFSGDGPVHCWAIAEALPDRLQPHVVERDRYYTLDCTALPPKSLAGPLQRASGRLTVDETLVFSASHRRLWAEFLGRADSGGNALPTHVRELYLRTPEALALAKGDLRLLNAWDKAGNLVACLLLDHAPKDFLSYVIGAHSKSHYVPHAADLLFATMLEKARADGKAYIHLGLGVNEGILRFKRKWGGIPARPYEMAAWDEDSPKNDTVRTFALALLNASSASRSTLLADSTPEQRPFAMIWELEKGGKRSWICGTAHFFRYSFERSFTRLFSQVDTVIFEGPLDEGFLAQVDAAAKTLPANSPAVLDLLGEQDIRRLERVVRGPEGWLPRLLNMEHANKADVRTILRTSRPWHAFFSLWTAFLERIGWHGSVDMEAWRLAHAMGKNVIGMEDLAEQLASLESVPIERILHYLRACDTWRALAMHNMRAYLAGELDAMMGTSAEFPTRTGTVISLRDQRFRERMAPWLEQGRCAVFVGAAHMLNLRTMLAEDGFSVRRCLPSLRHRLWAAWRGETGGRY